MPILQEFDPVEFVQAEISKLRTELLDFSTRNKLLSFKHSERASDFIRAVDELPAEMFRRLSSGGMRFKSLPHVTAIPADEATLEFRAALEKARLTNEDYLKAAKKLADDGLQAEQDFRVERKLRDAVRVSLGKAPILVRADRIDVAAFAKANGVNPDYNLPHPDGATREDHKDKLIQTLFLPEDLERRARKIYEAYQDHIQEKGINVLNAAFGFLEWYEDDSSNKAHHAPLLLAPLEIARGSDRGQIVYTISAEPNEAQVNVTLLEFLKQKHQLALPAFLLDSEQDQFGEETHDEAALLEPWLARVAEVVASKRRWRVCRFATIGTFPFSRIALYNDLATENWANDTLAKHEIVGRLLGGRGLSEAREAGTANDYKIDDSNFPYAVPSLVLEADSSQHSAVVDAIAGKSFVIQGPPGTGKSQTIANIIAAALDANKRILFIAEKSAALNVVSSRLKDRGFSPYLFEIHSDKTRKSDVLASVSERLSFPTTQAPEALGRKLEQRRSLRDNLARYVSLMGQPVGKLGRPLHELMWFSNRYACELETRLPTRLAKAEITHALAIDAHALDRYRAFLDSLASARDALLDSGRTLDKHPWRGVGETNRFLADQIVESANVVQAQLQKLAQTIASLEANGISLPENERELQDWVDAVSRIPDLDQEPILISLSLQATEHLTKLADYVERHALLSDELAKLFADCASIDIETLNEFLNLCEMLGVNANVAALDAASARASEDLQTLESTTRDLSQLVDFLGLPRPASTADALALVKAVTLFCEEREDVLDARTAGMLADGSERLIAIAGQKAVTLSAHENSLNGHLDMPRARREFSSEVLYSAADVLVSASLVSALSSEVRQANAIWRSLARNPAKTRMRVRGSQLREAAGLLAEAKEFSENPKHRAVLGSDFEGHNSNFDLYRAAADLLRSAATTMARSSAHFRSLACKQLLEESTQNFRLLRTRFSSNHFALLEHRLTRRTAEDEDLNKLVEESRLRFRRLASARETAQRLLTHDAYVPMDKAEDGEWSQTKKLKEWKRRDGELRGRSDIRNVLGSAYDAILAKPAVLRTALATAKAVEDAGLPNAMLEEIKANPDPFRYRQAALHAAPQLAEVLAAFRDELSNFAKIARLSETSFLGNGYEMRTAPLEWLHSRFTHATQSPESQLDWMRYKHALDDAISAPTREIATAFDALNTREERLADIFELCLVKTLIRNRLATDGGELAKLNGATLDDARARFAALDKELLDLEAKRIVAKTSLRPTPYGNDQGPRSSWSERALLENEVKKKKRHIPLRDLVRRAPNALRSLKPIWMMSPLTVAQYLPRSEDFFDIVIIDEASQMKPADAVGGLARANQAIIVGDPMQLPPTDFFGTSNGGSDAQEGASAGQSSILDLAEARLRQTRMLRWHYRSRHESLIAFSNKHFYNDRLVVFPSASDSFDGLGIEHVYVGGQYLGGGTNSEEARVIVDRARELMERNPELSIGLVTTNTDQRELVLEVLEKLAHENRKVADYRARWQETLEPLFVKNLENVQGDERDIILVSTVFGPGETGQVAQRFGPINSEAGHRRLNVLFTRAKRKIVLITSLRSGDIVPTPNANRGVHVLKDFLEYASIGRIAPGIETARLPDSDFEIHVAERLRRAGYEAVPQVGVDGFRIDIGVRHPGWPNGFLAGIECDGATYHSGVTVRDRDRLRQEILEGLGWRLYRVWSTDWFTNQEREMSKMLAWLDQVRATPVATP